ncbi:MAG: hypothetical protein DMG86_23160 [Acidobacteria bacterium]|nr:MAG: hypothetical protein DMG86_23160 [Acidobacteriota bacterium]
MSKSAPILRTAVRSKLRLELSYRDVSLPGTPIANEGTSDSESQEQPASQNSEWNVAAVL